MTESIKIYSYFIIIAVLFNFVVLFANLGILGWTGWTRTRYSSIFIPSAVQRSIGLESLLSAQLSSIEICRRSRNVIPSKLTLYKLLPFCAICLLALSLSFLQIWIAIYGMVILLIEINSDRNFANSKFSIAMVLLDIVHLQLMLLLLPMHPQSSEYHEVNL